MRMRMKMIIKTIAQKLYELLNIFNSYVRY